MKKYLNLDKLTISFAFISWFIPLCVSFAFIDPVTKLVTINNLLFHFILAVIAGIITYFTYKKLIHKNLLSLQTANTYLLVNIILDIVVLLYIFKVPATEWLTTILPAYILVFYGGLKLMKK